MYIQVFLHLFIILRENTTFVFKVWT